MTEEFTAVWVSPSVLRFRGRCDAFQAGKAEEALARADGSIEVDFAELDWITSAGIGHLLAAQQRLQKLGGVLRIVNVSPPIREMFELAGFHMVFDLGAQATAAPIEQGQPEQRSAKQDRAAGGQAAAGQKGERTGAQLVAASLAGDATAFPELVRRYEAQVFNAAYRITGSRADAEDVAQTSFLRVYERLARYDSKHRFFSWIYKICVNEALNLVARRRPSADVDRELADARADPEREARGREIGREIHRALQDLSPDQRVVIVLRHFRGLSYDDMSEVLEIPGKTVKSRLFEARRQLRRALGARKPG